MNETTVRELINQTIEENKAKIGVRNHRNQYAAGKKQQAELAELGILHLMPAKFGFSDADAVIRAAKMSKSAAFNAAGEGDEIAAHPLFVAINEVEQAEVVEIPSDSDYEWTAEEIAEYEADINAADSYAKLVERETLATMERETDLQEAVDHDETLALVMTSGEAVTKYNLSNSAVRQAIRDGAIPARKSGGTWLILRKHADDLWSKRQSAK